MTAIAVKPAGSTRYENIEFETILGIFEQSETQRAMVVCGTTIIHCEESFALVLERVRSAWSHNNDLTKNVHVSAVSRGMLFSPQDTAL